MIRTSVAEDKTALKALYADSIYRRLPGLVKWALVEAPERVVIVQTQSEIVASAYAVTCGYRNLWASYMAFRNVGSAKRLIEHLLTLRNEKRLRNLYFFCPARYVDLRVHLIAHGFIPEHLQGIEGIDYIVESHRGDFNPNYRIPRPAAPVPFNVRRGKKHDLGTLAKLLHDSLPRDFPTIADSASCVEKWLRTMREYTFVAEHAGTLMGVLLISPETFPVTDKNTAMLCYFAVDKEFRNRGVGKALVEHACKLLRAREKRSIEVDVSLNNIPARIFYTKTGFYPFWTSKAYMPHDDGVFYRTDF